MEVVVIVAVEGEVLQGQVVVGDNNNSSIIDVEVEVQGKTAQANNNNGQEMVTAVTTIPVIEETQEMVTNIIIIINNNNRVAALKMSGVRAGIITETVGVGGRGL